MSLSGRRACGDGHHRDFYSPQQRCRRTFCSGRIVAISSLRTVLTLRAQEVDGESYEHYIIICKQKRRILISTFNVALYDLIYLEGRGGQGGISQRRNRARAPVGIPLHRRLEAPRAGVLGASGPAPSTPNYLRITRIPLAGRRCPGRHLAFGVVPGY